MATAKALGYGDQGYYMTALTFGNVHGGVYKPGNVKLQPSVLKAAQEAVVKEFNLPEGSKPFHLVFHGGSGSLPEEIAEAVSYGVVKMNVDTDTQYAFTRPAAAHMFTNYDGVLKVDGGGRQQEGLRPALVGARRPRPGWPSGSSRPARTSLRRHARLIAALDQS